jgi:hypothetical protein
MGSRAEYVQISGSGPNALDFHIAYQIGRISATDPSAFVHIISKDKGFDPLVTHLNGGSLRVGRFESIDLLPIVRVAGAPPKADPELLPIVRVTGAQSTADRVALARGRLRGMKATKPRSLKTLSSTISGLFLKQLSEAEVSAVVRGLVSIGDVVLKGEAVSYGVAIEAGVGTGKPKGAKAVQGSELMGIV